MPIFSFNTYYPISPQSGSHTLPLCSVRAPHPTPCQRWGPCSAFRVFASLMGLKMWSHWGFNLSFPEDYRNSPSFQWPFTFLLLFTFSFLPTFLLGICLFLLVCRVIYIANIFLSPQFVFEYCNGFLNGSEVLHFDVLHCFNVLH